ncbi:MAG TPA: aminodeoxychorismate synthase, component I, partial [Opitutae bacterium]|nr:aminodeoxychorismate synthase, component I [Opitutae bacterium]
MDALIERFSSRCAPFVLDSSLSNDGLGQWSFFGADPFLVFEGKDGIYTERRTSQAADCAPSEVETSDGLGRLRELMAEYAIGHASGIPFVGGAVGFLAYDYGRQIEALPDLTRDDRELPDLYFGFYDGIAALNHATGELSLIALGIRADTAVVIEELQALITADSVLPEQPSAPQRGDWEWNMQRPAYLQSVERVRDYIASGDVYQVNLSQRAQCRFSGHSTELYRALRQGNPAPYSALIDTGSFSVLSTSPEQFLRKQGRRIETRPIKGTRPRGADAAEDVRNAQALRDSEKDRAE